MKRSSPLHQSSGNADCGTPPHIYRRFANQMFFGQSHAGGRRTIVPFRDELAAVLQHDLLREHDRRQRRVERRRDDTGRTIYRIVALAPSLVR